MLMRVLVKIDGGWIRTMLNRLISAKVLASAAGFALVVTAGAAAQGRGGENNAGKMAGDVYKNIQVLKDVPADQITPTMRVIARDLDVTCEFCHDEKDRSKDGLDAKDTARSMMAMMREINKTNFGGRAVVTCVTCHNGHSDPASVPTLPAFSVAMIGPGDEVKSPTLPTVDAVLAKYVQALGGEQALRKVTSLVATGTRQNYNPGTAVAPPFAIELYGKAPNMSVTISHTANGVASNGFDGTTAWAQDGRGRVTDITGNAASRAKRDADFYPALDLKQQFQRLTVTGIEKIGDRDTYVVVAVPQGEGPEQFYFDTQSGLLLRHQRMSPSAVGLVPMATDYENYKDIGNGAKFPYTIHIVGPSRPDCAAITVEKFQVNAGVDNSKFAKPQGAAQ
jgi:photosynthetic reaction center cytochrome c subunit